MKIAICDRPESFSGEWLRYCSEHNIDYKLVDCYDSDIIRNLEDCSGFMWHWSHLDSRAVLFAKELTYSLEKKGIKVFPDSKTCWHFNDKVGQKYLLEAINAPLVPSVVFYDKEKARDWAIRTSYPKVFKLRGGAGSENVRLVKNKAQAFRLIRKAFGRGFRPVDKFNRLSDKSDTWLRERNTTNFFLVLKELVRIGYPRYDDNESKGKRIYLFSGFCS